MRTHIVRTVTTLACLAIAALAAPAAEAHDGRGSGFSSPPASVFPQPRDPWRGWGLRSELPRRVGPPPSQRHDGRFAHQPAPGPVWVPGHWTWDGATWVWWPGHWGVR